MKSYASQVLFSDFSFQESLIGIPLVSFIIECSIYATTLSNYERALKMEFSAIANYSY